MRSLLWPITLPVVDDGDVCIESAVGFWAETVHKDIVE